MFALCPNKERSIQCELKHVMTCRRIINLHCLSAIYANRDTTEVQDIHFRPMFEATNKALSHPSFSLSTVSLFMADESGTFH